MFLKWGGWKKERKESNIMNIKRQIKEQELPKVVERTGLRGKDSDRVLAYLRKLRAGQKVNGSELKAKAKTHGLSDEQITKIKENLGRLGIIDFTPEQKPTVTEKVERAMAFLSEKIRDPKELEFMRNQIRTPLINGGVLKMVSLGLCPSNARTLQENLFSAGFAGRFTPIVTDMDKCDCNCSTGPCPAEAIQVRDEHGGSVADHM